MITRSGRLERVLLYGIYVALLTGVFIFLVTHWSDLPWFKLPLTIAIGGPILIVGSSQHQGYGASFVGAMFCWLIAGAMVIGHYI